MQDQQSGLDMERWLTPWRMSTYKRSFTWEANYLILIVFQLSPYTNICHTANMSHTAIMLNGYMGPYFCINLPKHNKL